MSSPSVLIVGGGLSGLSTAYYLSKFGIRSTIIEKAGRLGGLIKTDQMNGCSLEAGPDSYISTKPQVAILASELVGLPEKIISSNDQARRVFIVRDGRLVPMPKGMAMMVPGEWGPALNSPLLSHATKLRLLAETLKKPRTRVEDFSVKDLVTDHFGAEMLEYVAEPLLCGIYGGDAAALSANSVLPRFVEYERSYGSLIKGLRATEADKPVVQDKQGSLFRSFEGGMQTLTDALAAKTADTVPVVYAEAKRIERSQTGWRVATENQSFAADALVMACPAHISAQLLEKSAAPVAQELAAIPYSSAILAMLVFDKATLGHALNGFGFLIPRHERKTIAAATWVNTKFPSRIGAGLAALRGFIVGDKADELMNAHVGQQVISDLVLADFQRLMGIAGKPLFSTVYFWPRCMPQYVVGHAARMLKLQLLADSETGLHLAGNIFDGVGIPDTIRRGLDVAKHIASVRV